MVTVVICFLLVFTTTELSARAFGGSKYTKTFDVYFRKYSKRNFGVGMDWKWFKAQAIAESNLDNEAESWVKAKGIMQVMPKTYESLKKKISGLGDITDVRWNIAAGIYYDRKMWDYWKAERPFADRLSFMFASYNAGAGTILKAQKVCSEKGLNENLWGSVREIASKVKRWRSKETLQYIEKIFLFRESLD